MIGFLLGFLAARAPSLREPYRGNDDVPVIEPLVGFALLLLVLLAAAVALVLWAPVAAYRRLRG